MYDIVYACHYQLKFLLMERSFNFRKKGVGYNLFSKTKNDLKNQKKKHLPLMFGKIIFFS